MKNIYYILILLSLPLLSFGQTPKSGALTSETWNYDVWITAEATIGDGVTIIISPGYTVYLNPGVSLNITGTGRLLAQGSAGNEITFTAYGSNPTWGHLYFNSTTATDTSKLEYCIIEKGKATSLSVPYGGGIMVRSNYLKISNCTIKDNQAAWGGGIFLYTGFKLSIKKSLIDNNSAASGGGGGGIYFWNLTTATVTNCIITNNYAGGSSSAKYGGGGVMIGHAVTNVRLINCVIVDNTCPVIGDNVLFFKNSSSNASVLNSIIWGSANSVAFYGQTGVSSNLVNCAIEGSFSSTFTTCVDLNSNNSASDGPNFKAIDGTDWSLNFISPCRDKGVNTYTGVTIPALDYPGNPRIYVKDIGAYEYQYSRWFGTTSDLWATSANWWASLAPTSGISDVIIPTGLVDYPTGSTSQDFTIGTGKYMIIAPGAHATLNSLANNGTLKLESDADNIATLILGSYTDNGTEEIELYLTGGGNVDDDNFKWHYISSPVSSLPVSTFAPGTTLDVAYFYDSLPSFSLLEGWIAYDGYIYSNGHTDGPTFSVLTPGRGYNYWDNANNTFTFSGSLNTSNEPMSLGYNGTPSLHGFNLLGNPFSSGLDWDQIIDDSYFTYPSETSKSLYFTRDNVQCTYASGVGVPSDVTGIIPPMQGFFVKTYATGKTITLPAAARTHNSIHARYKGKALIPLVRLAITDNGMTDETVIRFDDAAKAGLDYDFDAAKMFISDTKTQIWSALSGTKYTINGQPFPETILEIPVVVNITMDGTHSISVSQLQGLDNYTVTLTDNVTGFTANLRTTPEVTFTASAGTISDRFTLTFNDLPTATEDPTASSKTVFNIYNAYGLINIQTMADEWDGLSGSVRILDLAGKIVTDQQNKEFSKNSVVQVQGPGAKGLYFVEIRSGMKKYVGKVVMK